MKARNFIAGAVVAFALPLLVQAQQTMPQMKTCEPAVAKIGDVVTVTGENLDKANVDKVFLTDQKDDFVVEIVEQTATAIKIKVPPKIRMGRMALMLLTKEKTPKLIEQPVKLTVAEKTEPAPAPAQPPAEQAQPQAPAQQQPQAPAQPQPAPAPKPQ